MSYDDDRSADYKEMQWKTIVSIFAAGYALTLPR